MSVSHKSVAGEGKGETPPRDFAPGGCGRQRVCHEATAQVAPWVDKIVSSGLHIFIFGCFKCRVNTKLHGFSTSTDKALHPFGLQQEKDYAFSAASLVL